MPKITGLKRNTQEQARLLATQIVVDGEKPTAERIRARLEGKGGQQAIQQGLQEVDGLRQEIKEKARAYTLLDKALAGERAKITELNGQIGKLEQENQKLQQEVVQTREANEDLVSQKAVLELSLADARKELAETQTAFERLKQQRADETEAQVGKIIELLNTRLGES